MFCATLSDFTPLTMTDDEVLRRARYIRQNPRQRPTFDTVDEEEATREGFIRVTSGYALRQFEQCRALEKAIQDLRGVEFRLVKVENRIFIWRRKPTSTISRS
jgi:hypothetical protein